MPAWRARERFLDMLNGDEGASFNLILAWIDKVEGLDDTTTLFFFVEMADSGRFEATVKPLYKNTGYKNILTNKNISPGPEVFPPAPKNNLRIRIFLLNFGPKFFLHAKYDNWFSIFLTKLQCS